MQNVFGIGRTALTLSWFTSYLIERWQSIVIECVKSNDRASKLGCQCICPWSSSVYFVNAPSFRCYFQIGCQFPFLCWWLQIWFCFWKLNNLDNLKKKKWKLYLKLNHGWMNTNKLILNFDKSKTMFRGKPIVWKNINNKCRIRLGDKCNLTEY